jgi:pimeloyl-ACP methyl ester carboxylesterase
MIVLDILKSLWGELVLLAVLFSALILLIRFRLRMATAKIPLQKEAIQQTTAQKIRQVILYTLRLTGFAALSLLLAVLAIMIYRVYYGVSMDTAPTPSQVEIPTGLSFQVEEVQFISEDSVQIAGWFVPSRNGATIILLHGYGGNRSAMLWHAQQMVDAGYGVLMYDERASGESGGTHRSYGWEDPRDVDGALKFLKNKYGADSNQVGIAGCSMGAQIALQGAAYNTEIGAVWADGTAIIRAQDIPPQSNILTQLVVAGNYMMDWASAIKLGMDAPPPMIEIIDDIAPRPIMLVGGGVSRPLFGNEGRFMLYYAQYAGNHAETWIIPEAYHCDGPMVRPNEYAARMIKFFDSAFGLNR